MVFQGTVKSDTHQLDSEIARIELEMHDGSVEGTFATLFCPGGGEPYLTADGYRTFKGRVTKQIPPEGFAAELHGNFKCHYFDCGVLYIEVSGKTALIYEEKEGRAVTLFRTA